MDIKVGDKLVEISTGDECEVTMTQHRRYEMGYIGVRFADGNEAYPLSWDGGCPASYRRLASEVR